MLRDVLIEQVLPRFADRAPERHAGQNPVISFPPIHPSWERVEIWDDEDEATIHFGDFTHVHVGNYQDELTIAERERRIVADVIEYLDLLFADKLEFYNSGFSGGCGRVGGFSRRRWPWQKPRQFYVWSGPLAF